MIAKEGLKAERKDELVRRLEEFAAQRRPVASVRTIKTITSTGLSPDLHAELLSKLPVRQGDAYTPEARDKVIRAVLEFDEHLIVSAMVLSENEVGLLIGMKDAAAPERIRVGGNVQQARLIRQPRPLYPPEAKQARIQGVVKLSAIIGKDGTIQQLEVVSGHPMLVPAALEAVKQWVYQITLLNAAPVEVATQIDINFTLSQ
jgi:TonB family protein